MRRDKHGFTLIELMIVIAIIAVIAAIAIPGLLAAMRSANERSAATSLKTLSTSEADFRANDRDWNHVNDYWTFNVMGLFCMTSTAVAGSANANTTQDPAIKLIELSVASADSEGALPVPTGECAPLNMFAIPSAKAGYWYIALVQDQSLAGTPDMTYKQATDNGAPYAMGSVHNTSKFGFLAYPDSQSTGKFVFIVNENNTIYRSATSTSVRPSTATPPGSFTSGPYTDWPTDANLKAFWAKIDG
jgi:prepilin-type N-terminal cleavage/methylation domain-containing protein